MRSKRGEGEGDSKSLSTSGLNRRGGGVMDKCDKCQNMARVTVSGSNLNSYATSYLCAKHAAALCLNLGDRAGHAKFTALIEGDRELKGVA
jgi:hypothetical protein